MHRFYIRSEPRMVEDGTLTKGIRHKQNTRVVVPVFAPCFLLQDKDRPTVFLEGTFALPTCNYRDNSRCTWSGVGIDEGRRWPDHH